MLHETNALSPIELAAPYLASAPVDLSGLAQRLGLIVQLSANLPDAVSGKIERAGNGFRITLNGSDGSKRQRFTQTHELAHYMLHRDKACSTEATCQTTLNVRQTVLPRTC